MSTSLNCWPDKLCQQSSDIQALHSHLTHINKECILIYWNFWGSALFKNINAALKEKPSWWGKKLFIYEHEGSVPRNPFPNPPCTQHISCCLYGSQKRHILNITHEPLDLLLIYDANFLSCVSSVLANTITLLPLDQVCVTVQSVWVFTVNLIIFGG